MPEPLFAPVSDGSRHWSQCGPFMTVQFLTGQMIGKPRDELDMTLTDIGPYLKAYGESRTMLQTPPGASPTGTARRPGAAAGIKF